MQDNLIHMMDNEIIFALGTYVLNQDKYVHNLNMARVKFK